MTRSTIGSSYHRKAQVVKDHELKKEEHAAGVYKRINKETQRPQRGYDPSKEQECLRR